MDKQKEREIAQMDLANVMLEHVINEKINNIQALMNGKVTREDFDLNAEILDIEETLIKFFKAI